MAYKYYIKNYPLQELELYFESVPAYSIRATLKQHSWIWNPARNCWTTHLCSDAEAIAKSIGAVDGTPTHSNPATNTEGMDLGLIRKSMSETFNSPKFLTYSLKEINTHLNNATGPEPEYVKLDTEYTNGFAAILCDSNSQFFMIGVTDDQSQVDEYREIFDTEHDFAKKLIRCIVFLKPYILYKNSVCRIIAVSDTEMIRQIVAHTRSLNNTEIVDIWVYNLKRPCCAHKESVQSVTAYVRAGSSGTEQMINVAYCPVCNRYYINSDQYRAFAQKHTLPHLRLRVTPDAHCAPDYSEWNEESILHCMGYSVNAANDLSAESRREILMHAIDTRTLTKVQVISFLEFLIHQNEGRDHFYDACSKWRSDVEFIRAYRMREQPFVRGRFTER